MGGVRKYDSRLQIEMLRAYMPDKFKTHGQQVPVISGDNNQVLVIGAAERDKLVRLRQEPLQEMARERQDKPAI